MGAGTDDHDAGGADRPQGRVQAGGQRAVTEVVAGELRLPAAGGEVRVGRAMIPALVTRMSRGPCHDRGQVGQVEGLRADDTRAVEGGQLGLSR